MQTKSDAYRFRHATESDLPKIAELFARHDYGVKRLEWLKWKYLENPDGPALIYVAEDANGNIISVTARLPRRFKGRKAGEFAIYQSVDLFTDAAHRGKGINRQLSDYAKAERDFFLLGFPNDLSRKIKELDHDIPLQDWFFPVILSQSKRLAPLKGVAPLADAVSKAYAAALLGFFPDDLQIKEITKFVRDYYINKGVIYGVRSAAYLNWRFINNPMFRYHTYEFFQNEQSIGYCVYSLSGTAAEVYDLICERRERGCIRLLVEHCRSQNITHLNFRGANLNMRRFGFFSRPTVEDCITTDIPNGPRVPEGPWMLTLADRDA